LSKLSSVGFIPMAFVMSAIVVFSNRPMEINLGFFQVKSVTSRWQRFAVVIGVTCVALLGCGLVIWAIYGFRYSAENSAMAASGSLLGWNSTTYPDGWFPALVKTLNGFHILPETVLYGFSTIANITRAQLSFILGRYSLDGFWYYYPLAFVLKAAWPFQVVLLGRIGLVVLDFYKSIRMRQTAKLLGTYYMAVPLIVVAAVYTIFAMHATINIGIRHFMPVYLVLFVFAGGILKIHFRKLWINSSILVAALAVAAMVSWGARSNYLAYFSFLPDGKKYSYRYLTDSNIDWGGELLSVKAWLDSIQQTKRKHLPVHFSYFGSALPEYYGIKDYIRLPGYNYEYMQLRKIDLRPLRAGIYVISPVSFITTAPYGPWTDRHEHQYQLLQEAFEKITHDMLSDTGSPDYNSIAKIVEDYDLMRMGKLCAYLKQREPDDIIADSILVYILTEEELKAAT